MEDEQVQSKEEKRYQAGAKHLKWALVGLSIVYALKTISAMWG